jgi:N-acetylglucosamine-6-phosphate deacetylase
MICYGLDPLTGAAAEVRFDTHIESVSPSSTHTGFHIAPAWIDLQVNGFAGVNYNDGATPLEEIARSISVLFSTGVARFYPTVITGPRDGMLAALRTLARAAGELPDGDAIAGLHLEGPHISPDDGPRGAHPRESVRPPDLDEFRAWQDAARGRVRIVTLAPEWPGALRYIEAIVAQGVVAAIGHTGANTQQLRDAVSAGATLSTHLGNGCHEFLLRHPNYLWDQMAEDRLMAGLIVDGIHLDSAFLTTAIRAKGVASTVLVTDAAPPAAAPPGRYRFAAFDVDHTPDGRVVLAGTDCLAGSVLRMDRAVANVMRLAGVNLAAAVSMATLNPARAARLPHRAAGLVPGDLADLVLFRMENAALQIHQTWLAGRLVYTSS